MQKTLPTHIYSQVQDSSGSEVDYFRSYDHPIIVSNLREYEK